MPKYANYVAIGGKAHDACVAKCPLMTQSGHGQIPCTKVNHHSRHALGLTIILNFSLSALLGGNPIPLLLEMRPIHNSPRQIARALRALRNAHKLGLLRGVRILPGPKPCEAVVAQFGTEYPGNKVPRLPLRRCTRNRCDCKYVPIGSEKFHRLRTTKKPSST